MTQCTFPLFHRCHSVPHHLTKHSFSSSSPCRLLLGGLHITRGRIVAPRRRCDCTAACQPGTKVRQATAHLTSLCVTA
jgi:hypothetical protein